MMLSRRCPSPIDPSAWMPWSSGPRCESAEHIRSSRSSPTGRAGSKLSLPAMPHMRGVLPEDREATDPRSIGRPDLVEVDASAERLPVVGASIERHDAAPRLGHALVDEVPDQPPAGIEDLDQDGTRSRDRE